MLLFVNCATPRTHSFTCTSKRVDVLFCEFSRNWKKKYISIFCWCSTKQRITGNTKLLEFIRWVYELSNKMVSYCIEIHKRILNMYACMCLRHAAVPWNERLKTRTQATYAQMQRKCIVECAAVNDWFGHLRWTYAVNVSFGCMNVCYSVVFAENKIRKNPKKKSLFEAHKPNVMR